MIKPGSFLAAATAIGATVTWLMAHGMAYRTGLGYAWFTKESINNLGALGLDTVLDLFDLLASPIILIVVCVGIVAVVVARRRFSRASAAQAGLTRSTTIRGATVFILAAFLFVFYLFPSTHFRDQLKTPPFYFLNTRLEIYDVVGRVAQWQQRLQVCAAVGELRQALAAEQIDCEGSQFDAPSIANFRIHSLYFGYVLAACALIVLVYPTLQRLVAWGSPSSGPATNERSISASVAAGVALLVALGIPWEYATLRAEPASDFGNVPGTGCSGYKIPAGENQIILYDPVQPQNAYEVAENRFMHSNGPRPNALSAFLAEQLSPRDLTTYPQCDLSKLHGT